MMSRPGLFVSCIAVGLAGAFVPAAGAGARDAIRVGDDGELAAAVAKLLDSGGTIALRPGRYGSLVVPPRASGAPPLRVVGSRGSRIERVLLAGTARVTLRRLTIAPRTGDAWVEVRDSTEIELEELLVTAQGTPYSAQIVVAGGRRVSILRSELTHCGDRSPQWTNCLRLHTGASDVLVEGSWFHDCRGCDFIHGRPGSDLVVRGNRFERALPCTLGATRCGHQDLVELFAGRRLRFERNVFGVYREGGAQLYLTGPMEHVAVTNNVFLATDPRVPGHRVRLALVVGSRGADSLPLHVTVANNTLLAGARRADGYAGSLRMSGHYRFLPRSVRPVVANNVIALLASRFPVCTTRSTFVANVVARGRRCTRSDRVGDPNLDLLGRPTARSRLVIDRAARRYATAVDLRGRARGPRPDIGAYEYREGR